MQTVLYEANGPVGWLWLNNPERHNSLGEQELTAIQGYLGQIERNSEIRVLVVSGKGERTFCAGAALQELGAGHISGEQFQATTDRIAVLPIPTVCALNGNVFGGGAELALACDFRIGVSGTRLRVPAAAIGLCYPIAGIQRFVERLGVPAAKRMLLAAEEFSATELLRLGFVNELVAPEELLTRATELANSLAALAPIAIRSMKAVIAQAAGGGIDRAAADKLAAECLASDDLQEGFAAVREKRAPHFKGH